MFRINILEGTKTSTSGRRYYLEDGPGCMGNPRVDPVLALAIYLMVRGDADSFLFCPFNALPSVGWEMSVHIEAKDNFFVESLRHSFDETVVGSQKFLGTHSCKRGGVQLYRLLGVADAEIKERGGWHTMPAFWSYVQESNLLEKRFPYTSPAAALADVIVNGREVPDYVHRSSEMKGACHNARFSMISYGQGMMSIFSLLCTTKLVRTASRDCKTMVATWSSCLLFFLVPDFQS